MCETDDEFDQESMEQAWYEESLQQQEDDDGWKTQSLTGIEDGDLDTAFSHADRAVHGIATSMLEYAWAHILRAKERGTLSILLTC